MIQERAARALPEPTPGSGTPVSSAAVMRRALLVWGLGHITLGDRRGWVLIALQVLLGGAIVVTGAALLEGTRASIVLLLVVAFVTIWGGQAIHAYRLAEAAGRGSVGAVQLFAVVPVAIAAVTVYWLVAGTSGSPAATLERYVSSWNDRRADAAVALFTTPATPTAIEDGWLRQETYVQQRVAALRASADASSGLDPARPLASLVYELRGPEPGSDQDRVTVDIDIVRRVSVRTTLFGVFPAASQQTVTAERVGRALLRSIPTATVFGATGRIWRVESVTFDTPMGPYTVP